MLSSSGPILESRQTFLQTSTSVHELAQRLSESRLSLHTSATSLHSQPPPVTTTGHLGVLRAGRGTHQVQPGLFHQLHPELPLQQEELSQRARHFRTLCCGGGNTSDTQSSSSVNIMMGPSARAASQATWRGSEPWEPTDATSRGSFVTDVWRRLWQRLSGLSAGEQTRRTWAWTTRPRSR
ncbi:pecanex-like protein 2, partial [Rhinopithecus roxellana]|uniref:pecanex-like protein 2 n=1 Tax=Rhinopithecus roxellana TaxID=61622 RepID=UPI0012371087